jgi:multiple sugar transport system ATP-binding protein
LQNDGIAAEIEVVEPMGAETEILVKIQGQTFTLMTHGRSSAGPGDKIRVAPQAAHAHLFDAASGRRI